MISTAPNMDTNDYDWAALCADALQATPLRPLRLNNLTASDLECEITAAIRSVEDAWTRIHGRDAVEADLHFILARASDIRCPVVVREIAPASLSSAG